MISVSFDTFHCWCCLLFLVAQTSKEYDTHGYHWVSICDGPCGLYHHFNWMWGRSFRWILRISQKSILTLLSPESLPISPQWCTIIDWSPQQTYGALSCASLRIRHRNVLKVSKVVCFEFDGTNQRCSLERCLKNIQIGMETVNGGRASTSQIKEMQCVKNFTYTNVGQIYVYWLWQSIIYKVLEKGLQVKR